MADISKIKLPSGDTYNLKDSSAVHSTDDLSTVPVSKGGTGETTAKDAANSFVNALDTASATPKDADYFISQYTNGGTTNTTYYRRPISTLWTYISGKISSVLGLTDSAYGGSAAQVNGHTVQSDVPANAAFTDTTYTGTSPITVSGTAIAHESSGVTAASKGDTTAQTPTWGGTFKAVSGTVNSTGHLTAFDEHTVTIPSITATTSAVGLMSAEDKDKLDSMTPLRMYNGVLQYYDGSTWTAVPLITYTETQNSSGGTTIEITG